MILLVIFPSASDGAEEVHDVHILDHFAAVLAGAAHDQMLAVIGGIGQQGAVLAAVLLQRLGNAVESLLSMYFILKEHRNKQQGGQ